ncbi:hypothetical protein QBC39DRAFT_423094 [Podospora conica]|nr:hypothetical protein QBC39DRAFT_423094 [Schizothecium conicum]
MASAGSKTGGLPSGFIHISDISQAQPGTLVSVIGLVADCQLPMPTNGSDYKCTLTLCDLSSQSSSDGIVLNIFRPEASMPKVPYEKVYKYVVVVHSAKVQRYRTTFASLITHHLTKIRVYSDNIPRPPASAVSALFEGDKFELSEEVHRYVPRLWHDEHMESILPSKSKEDNGFQQRVSASSNVKQKFCLLSEVDDGRFCDLVVHVCREPYDLGDKVTLYASDYTENPSFFNFSWDSIKDLVSRSADPYGYTGAADATVDEGGKATWVGPLGKRAIQITAFEPHASFIRSYVTAGKWISLRNVQIKYGHDNQNLEGKLRGDQDFPNKLNVSLVDVHTDITKDATRCKDAARRWKQYNAEVKAQLKQLKAAETAGVKRKAAAVSAEAAHESVSRNSTEGEAKTKAQIKRAKKKAAQRGETAIKIQQPSNPRVEPNNTSKANNPSAQTRRIEAQLNPHVRCEKHTSAPMSSIATIIAPSYHRTTINDEEVNLPLPFVNAKYQSHVRVVDFHPPSLEEFAVGRNKSQYEDILSDDEVKSSDDESLAPTRDTVWEWRFSLQLEDASSPSPQRIWVVVNNTEGQMLTGLDATDLRRDVETLSALYDRMATLWGNLGELKAKAAAKRARSSRVAACGVPPPGSSDVEDEGPALVNKPFTCCIYQYGVPFQGEGGGGAQPVQEWTRVFALAGTMIKH